MSKVNRISLAVTVVLAALLALLLWQSEQTDQARQAYITEYTNRLKPLLDQRTDLQQQLSDLERNYTAETGGTGAVVLVCLTPDEQVYTELYPQLQAHGFAATLALAPSALPGTPGCITLEEYTLLCAGGWQPCILWDGTTPLGDWLAPVQAWLDDNGFTMPQAVYLPPMHYTTDLDADLLANGFTILLNHGEDGTDLATGGAAPWRVTACGWYTTTASDRAANLAYAGGAAAFTIGFGAVDESVRYDPGQLANMLNKLSTWQQNGTLLVTDLAGAKATRAAAEESQAALSQQYENQKQMITQQLNDLETKIYAIKATWHWEY